MTEPASLLKKLQIKSGSRLWLINVPRPIAEAVTAGAEVEPVHAGESFDGVLAFCETVPEVEVFSARILERMPEDGLLWFAYRKGAAAKASGLNRDLGWQALDSAGWRPVRSIAIDAEWSGVRFRPIDKVKAKPGSMFAR